VPMSVATSNFSLNTPIGVYFVTSTTHLARQASGVQTSFGTTYACLKNLGTVMLLPNINGIFALRNISQKTRSSL